MHSTGTRARELLCARPCLPTCSSSYEAFSLVFSQHESCERSAELRLELKGLTLGAARSSFLSTFTKMLRSRLSAPSSLRAIGTRALSTSSSAPLVITPSKLCKPSPPSPASHRADRSLRTLRPAPAQSLTPLAASLLASDQPPVVLDASWHMPNLVPPRHAFAEFKTQRIPNAAFWSVDVIATKDERGLAHNIPTAAMFADACCEKGEGTRGEES